MIRVSNIRPTWTPPEVARTGLIAHVSCVVADQILLDGLSVRVTRQGRYALAYPTRRDSRGREHPIALVLGDEARQAVEDQVLRALYLVEDPRP